MGFLDQIFRPLTKREELLVRATHTATSLGSSLDEVIEMGILAAQLGLTPSDMEKLARLYVKGALWDEGDQEPPLHR